ncbi:hypothetical protein [Streptomyces sp. NPDC018693]|uniref:hypothetical protein n=1 Tax=unclassified Streptomyces TaxID=2593676 RepID=UPI00379CC5CD
MSTWEPSRRVAELLFVDFDGSPAIPDDVISDGLDGGYRGRSEPLTQVLWDAAEDPAGRFLACVALTRWADEAGYAAVVEAAGALESVAWRGASYDRLHGQDDTFGVLADAVGNSVDMVDERGTASSRVEAACALLGIADRVRFDRHIGSLLCRDLVIECLPVLKAVVARGIARWPATNRPSFDLGLQLTLVIAVVHPADATWATRAEHALMEARQR